MLSRAGQSPESQLSAFLRGRSLMAIFEIVKLIFAFNYPAHAHVTRSLDRAEEDTDEGGSKMCEYHSDVVPVHSSESASICAECQILVILH